MPAAVAQQGAAIIGALGKTRALFRLVALLRIICLSVPVKTSMRVPTSAVRDNGSSILLMLEPSEELLAEQSRIASIVPGQVPVRELHVTLLPSAHSDKSLPPPPPFIDLHKSAYLVKDQNKTSVYLRVTETSQSELARYAATLEETFSAQGLLDKKRIFHVSLTNRSGKPDESVARIREHPSIPL